MEFGAPAGRAWSCECARPPYVSRPLTAARHGPWLAVPWDSIITVGECIAPVPACVGSLHLLPSVFVRGMASGKARVHGTIASDVLCILVITHVKRMGVSTWEIKVCAQTLLERE